MLTLEKLPFPFSVDVNCTVLPQCLLEDNAIPILASVEDLLSLLARACDTADFGAEDLANPLRNLAAQIALAQQFLEAATLACCCWGTRAPSGA